MSGVSTPSRRASASAARAVVTPSATCGLPASTSARCSPRPSASPTVRLRLKSAVQVRTRSPMPARPMSVTGFAPRRTASRVISASPRVMSAARALWPSARPSQTPVAIAITFLSAPATSTPTTSVERLVPRRDDDGGRAALPHLARERRPGEKADAGPQPRGQDLVEDLAHEPVRLELDALGRAHDDDVVGGVRRPARGELARVLRGADREDEGAAAHGLHDVAGGAHVGGQVHAGKKGAVLVPLVDVGDDLRLARPDEHVVVARGEHGGEGGAPGARPDDGDAGRLLRHGGHRTTAPARLPTPAWPSIAPADGACDLPCMPDRAGAGRGRASRPASRGR